MNGPSPTRMRSAARTFAGTAKHSRVSNIATGVKSRFTVLIKTLLENLPGVMRHPRRDLAVDPLLQFDYNCAHQGKHDKAGEHLLGLHHLSGIDQQETHSALARSADHLGRDNQD